MRVFRDAPIRTKLTLIGLVAVGGALLLSGIILTLYEYRAVKTALVEHLEGVADLVGTNSSAAVSFERRDGAEEVLESLRMEPAVVYACIYDSVGKPFAQYRTERASDASPPARQPPGHVFNGAGDLELSRPIVYNNSAIGAIYLRASMEKPFAPVRQRMFVGAAVMLGALVLVLLLTARLNQTVAQPILQLAEAMRAISERNDYSLRVPKLADDEIGVLCDGFNAMLAQLHKRDGELEQYRLHLEKLVQERTRSLEAKTEELARSNAELELFASVASHDLQEPLRMISSYVELLAQRYQSNLDERARRWVHFAVDGAVRMKQLINDLLEFSRVGTRGKPFEPIDFAQVFHQATTNLQRTIEERGARVTHGPLPTVVADGGQLTQLLQNLIGNGIKFCKQGQPEVNIEAVRQDGVWRFSVRDNGIGIDPQFAERIFVIFQRLHTREEYAGTGIGLAVCRKIVERHGGRIWVESQPGQGATFYFTIPEHEEHDHGT